MGKELCRIKHSQIARNSVANFLLSVAGIDNY